MPLTLVFATGIAVVLVPVTLGIGFLTRSLLQFHGPSTSSAECCYWDLAVISAMGVSWALPMLRSAPDIQRTDSGGVFALGVFSGAASACCAPVLAGVLTMSAIAPSLAQGVAIGLTYVFGMVFPLLVMTVLWDRLGLGDRPAFRGREVQWSLAGRTFTTNSINLVAAGLFAVMADRPVSWCRSPASPSPPPSRPASAPGSKTSSCRSSDGWNQYPISSSDWHCSD